MNKHKAARLNNKVSEFPAVSACFIPTKSNVENILPKIKIPIKNPKSPIRFMMNAFLAASL